MKETNKCERCGIELPSVGLAQGCPRCLLAEGLEPRTRSGPDRASTGGAAEALTLDRVAASFPQLELRECLGRGGMGSVFLAHQVDLDRQVALKVLDPELGRDPEFRERFTREARALARLSHPNVVTVHDYGEVDGLYYLIMELVDGASLRDVLAEGSLSPEQALALVPPLCDALQHAHEAGIVHRDIKPDNILLDREGHLKVVDFGIARLVQHDDRGNVTHSGVVLGTPHYMAPEQLEHPDDVDHRADIYAIGVVIYEMLTGELPLGRFPPPSQSVKVDVRIDEVVLKALEKDPSRRYQSASAVKTDVQAVSGPQDSGAAESVEQSPGVAELPPLTGGLEIRLWRALIWTVSLVAGFVLSYTCFFGFILSSLMMAMTVRDESGAPSVGLPLIMGTSGALIWFFGLRFLIRWARRHLRGATSKSG